jgi:hypothetical protein
MPRATSAEVATFKVRTYPRLHHGKSKTTVELQIYKVGTTVELQILLCGGQPLISTMEKLVNLLIQVRVTNALNNGIWLSPESTKYKI